MGIYPFNTAFLYEQLIKDADPKSSTHDFGRDILPLLIKSYRVQAYPYRDPQTGRQAYWRDVGTVDAYWEANMELIGVTPELNLYDESWADLDLSGADAAGQVRIRRRRPARHGGGLDGLGRRHHFGFGRCAARCCSPTCASGPTARSPTR